MCIITHSQNLLVPNPRSYAPMPPIDTPREKAGMIKTAKHSTMPELLQAQKTEGEGNPCQARDYYSPFTFIFRNHINQIRTNSRSLFSMVCLPSGFSQTLWGAPSTMSQCRRSRVRWLRSRWRSAQPGSARTRSPDETRVRGASGRWMARLLSASRRESVAAMIEVSIAAIFCLRVFGLTLRFWIVSVSCRLVHEVPQREEERWGKKGCDRARLP